MGQHKFGHYLTESESIQIRYKWINYFLINQIKLGAKSGTRTPGPGTSGPWDLGTGDPPQILKVGPQEPLQNLKGRIWCA